LSTFGDCDGIASRCWYVVVEERAGDNIPWIG
jgi:hypothetical protein